MTDPIDSRHLITALKSLSARQLQQLAYIFASARDDDDTTSRAAAAAFDALATFVADVRDAERRLVRELEDEFTPVAEIVDEEDDEQGE